MFDEQLKNLKENMPGCKYIGFIPSSSEYPDCDILYLPDNIYIAQRKNILRLNKELSKNALKQIIEHYGTAVSPVLRPFIESKTLKN